jgi:Fe-S-cluster containining protein
MGEGGEDFAAGNITERGITTDLRGVIMAKPQCTRCGRCCLSTDHADVMDSDLKKWKGTFLEWDSMISEFDYFGGEPDLRRAFSRHIRKTIPNFRMRHNRCPFFHRIEGKALCLIHEVKPSFCHTFVPGSKHAKEYCNCPA